MMPARDFSALFTDRAGSRYIGGWTAPPSTKQMVRPIVFRPATSSSSSRLAAICLTNAQLIVCLLSLSLTYSSQRVLIIIDTFYTRLRLSAAFMYWGTSHRVQSSPCWNNQRVLLPPSLLCYTRAITHTICQLITPFRYFSPPLFIFIFYTTGRRRAG